MNYPVIPGVTIIGFGHKARNGKDQVARMLVEAWPTEVKQYAFADALKAYCRVCCGMTKKDGKLLQRVGTDELRAVNPDIWINALYWLIDEERPYFALITDVRFRNEADFIHKQGGYVIQVKRLNPDGTQYIAMDRDPNHPSETELDGYRWWDGTISAGSGDLENLKRHAIRMFTRLRWQVKDPIKTLEERQG